jgi:putative sterol carrier protein
MANLWWDSHLEGIAQRKPQEKGGVEDMRLLLRGMAVTFNPQVAGDLNATIQFEVSGKQPGDWFLSIERGRCTIHEGRSDSPTLTIHTPSEIWLAIANGEMDGKQALMEGEYAAHGDMGLLMRMNDLFGSTE